MAVIDEKTVDSSGMTESALMENAGQLSARHIQQNFLESTERVVILTGKGHNGADGMVAARWLVQWGHDVLVCHLFDPGELDGLPEKQYRSLGSSPVRTERYETESGLPPGELYVDALLGTGLQGDPRPPFDSAIRSLNGQENPVVSLDVPSGLNGDQNEPFDPCVHADLTVTFGLPKLGCLLEPGYSFTREVITQGIGFPQSIVHGNAGDYHLITPGDTRRYLPVRYPTIHKGSAGRLGVIGGSEEYPGAPFLTAQSASRIGSGLTSILGPSFLGKTQSNGERDLVFPGNLETLMESVVNGDTDFLVGDQDAVVIGPGLGQSTSKQSFLNKLLPELQCPAVVDADGLNNLKNDPEVFRSAKSLVLTPHPGEAARLLGRSVKTVLNDPVESLNDLVELTGHLVVLKTSRPLVGYPGGSISVNVSGSPALAKAGSGDVLSGLIGGLLAQKLDPGPATCLALYLHGAAGRHAADSLDTVSVKSEDVIDHVPTAIEELEEPGLPGWFPVKFESIPDSVYQWNPFPS